MENEACLNFISFKRQKHSSSCVIYKGTCSCGETYIGETIHNTLIRWEEYNDPTKESEPPKQLKISFDYVFNCVNLCKASQNYKVNRRLLLIFRKRTLIAAEINLFFSMVFT